MTLPTKDNWQDDSKPLKTISHHEAGLHGICYECNPPTWQERLDELTEQTHYCSDLTPHLCRNVDHLEVSRKALREFVAGERIRVLEGAREAVWKTACRVDDSLACDNYCCHRHIDDLDQLINEERKV